MTSVTRVVQVFIHKPLQTVFDYVSDLTKHPEWSDGELKIEAVTQGTIAVGKEYVSRGQVVTQKNRPNTVRVSAYEPPHRFAFVARDPDFGDVPHIFTFTEQDGGTLVTRTMTVSLNPFVAFAFQFFIYPLIGNSAMNKSFGKLKTRLESSNT